MSPKATQLLVVGRGDRQDAARPSRRSRSGCAGRSRRRPAGPAPGPAGGRRSRRPSRPRPAGSATARRAGRRPRSRPGPARSSSMWVTRSTHHRAWRSAEQVGVAGRRTRCSAPNWRMVSSSRNRRPNGPDSTTTIDCSTRPPSRSSTSTTSTGSAVRRRRRHGLGGGRGRTGPTKIESRWKSRCSDGVSRS